MASATLSCLFSSNEGNACLQDFETTISSHVTPLQLQGILNFTSLWNRVTYIYDTAIGDSPHIIASHLAGAGSPERRLFDTLRSLLESGALRVLVRSKVQVNGLVLYENPSITDIYNGWILRAGGDAAKLDFLTQQFGSARSSYNEIVDRILRESQAFAYYDPDRAKPEFRRIVNERLNDERFHDLVCGLPEDHRNCFFKPVRRMSG